MSTAIKPLRDNIVIKKNKAEETQTASGLYLSGNEEKDKKQGEVVAVGPGKYNEDGDGTIPLSVAVGDTVLYSWGDSIEHEGEQYEIVSESNILAIIN